MTQLTATSTKKIVPPSKDELEKLIEKLSEREKEIIHEIMNKADGYKQDIVEIYDVVCQFMDVLGLMTKDKKQILPEIASGEQKPIPVIMKSAMNLITLMGQAQVPVLGKSAEKELAEKFHFIPRIVPMIKKYAESHGG
jgi:hypothetical protein